MPLLSPKSSATASCDGPPLAPKGHPRGAARCCPPAAAPRQRRGGTGWQGRDPAPRLCVPGARLRLANGRNECEGRVEVSDGSGWGTVCDDAWGLSDAQVVCRQLGCGQATAALGNARFGPGSGRILLDDVQCSGHESSLQECRHNGWLVHNCVHVEDAGAVCSGAFYLTVLLSRIDLKLNVSIKNTLQKPSALFLVR
uniref:SRCR domain-containing protein n=1 Tax=Apteryx owenii TaxID=8824 RepID=A0A8B9SF06_APTOW